VIWVAFFHLAGPCRRICRCCDGGLNALSVASVTGDIPQNVNFAIKASVATAFLDAQGIAHADNARDPALSTPDIADRARSFTARVLCR
jgi:hypothetical protein